MCIADGNMCQTLFYYQNNDSNIYCIIVHNNILQMQLKPVWARNIF